jgi:hypothetical protein
MSSCGLLAPDRKKAHRGPPRPNMQIKRPAAGEWGPASRGNKHRRHRKDLCDVHTLATSIKEVIRAWSSESAPA